ncbi:alpha/beta fold hydrolase [Pseudonocardia sp. GCM10023141]|uniref:alpha/beta fold hydrolase n=1 Tax=Pseudonocardia sp. GCM10023141 TaxID=3252653 RepID=UPI0036207575
MERRPVHPAAHAGRGAAAARLPPTGGGALDTCPHPCDHGRGDRPRRPDRARDGRLGRRPILLLHGGAGPRSVMAFADQLAASAPARVLTPIHPGFAGTPRPAALEGIRGLAALCVELLAELDLTDVTVVGTSVGGWITAEMALLDASRISGIVLVDAVGIDVPEHPPVGFFALTPPTRWPTAPTTTRPRSGSTRPPCRPSSSPRWRATGRRSASTAAP